MYIIINTVQQDNLCRVRVEHVVYVGGQVEANIVLYKFVHKSSLFLFIKLRYIVML